MILRAWLERWRQWQARRLRHSRTQALWGKTKERIEKVRRTYRALPEFGRRGLPDIPEQLRRLQEDIYEYLLVQDNILVHLPPSRLWQRMWYTGVSWWYGRLKHYELAKTYEQLLYQLEQAERDRSRAWLQAKQIEARVERWLVELDVLHDKLLLLRSHPLTSPVPPPSLLETLQELQQEIENYQQSIEELRQWLDGNQR